jgi:Lrp/AsnC family leucine-responsive transcriptional regulator
MASNGSVDDIDLAILRVLRVDARLTMNELSRRIALSRPATTERIRRLERLGVITGYSANIDLSRIGRPVLAYVRVKAPGVDGSAIDQLIERTPQIIEWHHVTGEDCFITKVATTDLEELERVVDDLAKLGQTITSIVFSTRLDDRIEIP